jgi:hypothetical protein
MMIAEDIDDGVAFGDDIALEPPLAPLGPAAGIFGTGRLPIDAVIGAHDGAGLTLGYRRSEGRQVGLQLVMLAHIHVHEVPRRLRFAVHRKMLRRRDDAIALRIVSLHPGTEATPMRADRKGSSP